MLPSSPRCKFFAREDLVGAADFLNAGERLTGVKIPTTEADARRSLSSNRTVIDVEATGCERPESRAGAGNREHVRALGGIDGGRSHGRVRVRATQRRKEVIAEERRTRQGDSNRKIRSNEPISIHDSNNHHVLGILAVACS